MLKGTKVSFFDEFGDPATGVTIFDADGGMVLVSQDITDADVTTHKVFQIAVSDLTVLT